MLQTLKKSKNTKKSFYGINSGNYGFLMNKFSEKNMLKYISKSKSINISPLEMIAQVGNKNIKSLAKRSFNFKAEQTGSKPFN